VFRKIFNIFYNKISINHCGLTREVKTFYKRTPILGEKRSSFRKILTFSAPLGFNTTSGQ